MIGLYGKKCFETRLQEREAPAVTGDRVRIRVEACGVCGTDLHFLREMDDWTPMGHEIAAVVVETGPEATRVKPGNRVICEDVAMCGECEACKAGRPQLCRHGATLEGQPGMSDELVVRQRMLHVYDGIGDPTLACMTEPLAVALRGVDALHIRPFESVAVFGMGAIGLFSAAYARLLGAGRIAMFARRPGSLRNRRAEEAAAAYGADEIWYTAREGDLERALAGGAFDAAVVAAPPALTADALRLVGYGGRVMVMGVSFGKNPPVPIDVNDMVFGQKRLLTSLAEPAILFPTANRLIATGRIDASRLVTHRLPLSRHGELKELYAQDAPAIKTVMVMD